MADACIATIGHRFADAEVETRAVEGTGVEILYLGGLDKEEALGCARRADAVLLGVSFALDDAALGRLENCRVVVRYGIGLDNVDVAAATRRGIRVLNVPDYGIEEVANHALALLLALARRLDVLADRARSGNWAGAIAGLRLRRLSECTLLVIGAGRIGRALAERARPIWGDVLVFDPYLEDESWLGLGVRRVGDLDSVLGSADFVSLHVPATETTRGLMSAQRIGALKAGAVIVNCSRGDVIDEEALLAGLADGRVAAAGLDVFTNEPHPRSDLLSFSNVWPTPHAAWYSAASIVDLRYKAAQAAVEALFGHRTAPREP